ncbi:MAG: uncharacterized protein PWQ22_1679 [Archaeoglobaceae archaeon]|nr:uncharacterized protein [Archaeoglobaceae archaeon]
MMKRNPGISEEALMKRIRKFNIKRNFLMLFSVFLFLGIMVAISYPDLKTLKLSLATFLFLSSIFMTSVSLQQTTSAGVFEPLRSLPVLEIERYISILFLIDSLAILGIAIPSALLMALQDALNAFIYILWLIFAILLGHTVGMSFLAIFGVRLTRGSKSISKAFFGVFLILLIFTMIPELFGSMIETKIIEFSENYSLIFPFTVLCETQKSLILLLVYLAILIPINKKVSRRGVNALFEWKSENVAKKPFRVLRGGRMLALIMKDLKLIYRHPSGLLGILLPFLITAPQVLVVSSLSGGNSAVFQAITTVSLFSPIILGLITRGEGKEIDFLRTLPISKKDFLLLKVLTSSLLVCSASLALIFIAFLFGATPLAFLPAISIPLTTSLFSGIYLFNYSGEEIGIPDMGLRRMAILFILCIILIALLMTPTQIFKDDLGYATTFLLSLPISAFMFRKVRN